MNSREQALQRALEDIQNGVLSINKAAKAYKLNRATLQNRLRNRTVPRRIAHEQQQRLTPPQEEFLTD